MEAQKITPAESGVMMPKRVPPFRGDKRTFESKPSTISKPPALKLVQPEAAPAKKISVPAPGSIEAYQQNKIRKLDKQISDINKTLRAKYGKSAMELMDQPLDQYVSDKASFGTKALGFFRGLVGQPRDPEFKALMSQYLELDRERDDLAKGPEMPMAESEMAERVARRKATARREINEEAAAGRMAAKQERRRTGKKAFDVLTPEEAEAEYMKPAEEAVEEAPEPPISEAEAKARAEAHWGENQPMGVIIPENRTGLATGGLERTVSRTEPLRRISRPKTTRTHKPEVAKVAPTVETVPTVVTSNEEPAPIPLVMSKAKNIPYLAPEEVEEVKTQQEHLEDLAKEAEKLHNKKEEEYQENFKEYNKLVAGWKESLGRKKKAAIPDRLIDLHKKLKEINDKMTEMPTQSLSDELNEAIEEREEQESIEKLQSFVERNPQIVAEMEQLQALKDKENEYLRDVEEYNNLFKTKLKVDRKLQVIKNPEDITDRMVELHNKIKEANRVMKAPALQSLKTALDEAIISRENIQQTGT